MKATAAVRPYFLSRLKLFLALSRTPHGLLDLATPALSALLWLGELPPRLVALLGFMTAFGGYTAVYALNDLVDFRADREKIRTGGFQGGVPHLDSVWVRHPVAQGHLSFREGLVWAVGWAALAFAGAYWLNPVCAGILLLGCGLEALYCRLQEVTHFRVLVSGVVKTLGGLAAVFAVDPHPSPLFVGTLFLWILFWEIGGQNIPNDWHDIEEDRRTSGRTLPVLFGPKVASAVGLGALVASIAVSWILFRQSPARLPLPLAALGLLAGFGCLLVPGLRLCQTHSRADASALFNTASYYPLAVLLVVLLGMAP